MRWAMLFSAVLVACGGSGGGSGGGVDAGVGGAGGGSAGGGGLPSGGAGGGTPCVPGQQVTCGCAGTNDGTQALSLIHISEPTRPY